MTIYNISWKRCGLIRFRAELNHNLFEFWNPLTFFRQFPQIMLSQEGNNIWCNKQLIMSIVKTMGSTKNYPVRDQCSTADKRQTGWLVGVKSHQPGPWSSFHLISIHHKISYCEFWLNFSTLLFSVFCDTKTILKDDFWLSFFCYLIVIFSNWKSLLGQSSVECVLQTDLCDEKTFEIIRFCNYELLRKS